MHPAALAEALLAAVQAVVGDRAEVAASDIVLERPRSREHGDWTTNAAMRLAKRVGVAPRDLAAQLQERIATIEGVAAVEVAGPGFLNLRLDAAAAGELARTIVEAGGAYGRGDSLQGLAMNLEFVSANPTGPLHLGGTRWAAVGDSLARILESQGARVTREYYFNDHGAQIDRFARSLVAAWRGEAAPEDGYGGDYIGDIAARVEAASEIDLLDLDDAALQEHFREHGVQMMFGEIKQSLADFGVVFDVYFHEHDVQANGDVERAIERLRERGHVFVEDGATWLRTTTFGDDRDRVVVRSNGAPAYFSGDLAYYLNKRERGFDQCLIMLGADHHGYVGRMMAMCEAFGDEPGVNLQILIGQMVNLVRDGKPVRMSKRAGTIVTLEDLVEAVGVDAARYSLARSSVDTPLDIDLELLQRRSNDNPVFYVQYAHARTSAVARNAAAAGIDRSAFDASTLDHETEAALLGALADFPRVLTQAAQLREPHRIARFAEELAGLYHRWYDACRVVPQGDDPIDDRNRSRLWLNDATGQVLRTALGHLGVSAPERM
ncbi:arginine--tRNA ligase [Agrococcus sp. SGAir0287]|uniref:arginine--tRNA ligase n=1 Tax=Agrococcus sp. SGAir0287 TaxID=2070347 RepID=UPI0010CD1CB7|nr:arginine--tRNA ligase [Agrococcus sp. SGAir0287]QCR19715.1 arginine--tRNA ligase [Agrococcus sp. SGAir0287]